MRVRLTLYNFYLRLLTYVLPLLACLLALCLSFFLPGEKRAFDGPEYLHFILLTALTWAMVAESMGLTSVSTLFDDYASLRVTVLSCLATFGSITIIVFFTRLGNYSRVFIVTSALGLLLVTVVCRAGFRFWVLRHKERRNPHRILIIGADAFARRVAMRLTHGPYLSATVVGYVKLPQQDVAVKGVRIFGLQELQHFELGDGIDDIVIAVLPTRYSQVAAMIPVLGELSVPVRMALDLGRNVSIREKLFQIGRVQMMDLGITPAESPKYLLLKRGFDILFSLCALLLVGPLMLLIALVIRLTSPGPIFFDQERVGLNGKNFSMLKFRTMEVSTTSVSDTVWTTREDPRRTAFGTFLRKTSLDELPQFLNVLRGDMSVVGPRPERPYFVQQFRRDYKYYSNRHRLKVGITGWAQVNGYRGDTSIHKRVEHDLYYLSNWSFLFDLKIIGMTLLLGLVNRNAY